MTSLRISQASARDHATTVAHHALLRAGTGNQGCMGGAPPGLPQSSSWATNFSGPMRFRASISVPEGRAYFCALRNLVRDPRCHGNNELFLIDRFGAFFVLARGRSPQHCLLQLCRRSSALCLAGGLSLRSDGSPRNATQPTTSRGSLRGRTSHAVMLGSLLARRLEGGGPGRRGRHAGPRLPAGGPSTAAPPAPDMEAPSHRTAGPRGQAVEPPPRGAETRLLPCQDVRVPRRRKAPASGSSWLGRPPGVRSRRRTRHPATTSSMARAPAARG